MRAKDLLPLYTINTKQPILDLLFINKRILYICSAREGLTVYHTIKNHFITNKTHTINTITALRNSDIFATFSLRDLSVSFWNIKNIQSPLESIKINTRHTKHTVAFYYDILSFSYDGNLIFLIHNDTCFKLKVPFSVTYCPNTYQKCLCVCACLERYSQNILPLSNDIKTLLIHYLLNVCKNTEQYK